LILFMIVKNLNLLTVVIFVWILFFIWKIFYNRLKTNKKINTNILNINNKKLFCIFVLIISFIVSLLSIFKFEWKPSYKNIKNKWVDIMFVLDVSKSMNTVDIEENWYLKTRLLFAKNAIKNYVYNNTNNRYWLIIFAWDAITTVPLTSDIDIFTTLLEWVDYRNITKQWTNFSLAIKHSISLLEKNKNKWKVLVLISDWWDEWDYKWLNINIPNNIRTVIIWIWTKKWWKIYLWQNDFWENIFQIYNWQYVVTKLNEKNLQKLAHDINWIYFHMENIKQMKQINNYIKNISKQLYKLNIYERKDLTRDFVIVSFIFFVIYIICELRILFYK